ncbi:MAG: hypothetical protein N2485_03665 [bacterium]|nr:hypothetical protein [bacterium]
MYKCKAIVIDRKKILTGNKLKLFTDKLGKIETYYKFNIKNINLDKLNLLNINITTYRNKFYLQNYIVENYFIKIRTNYIKTLIAMYLIELIDKTIDFDFPEAKIFNMFVRFLNFLENEEIETKIYNNLLKFINYYLVFLGYGNLFNINKDTDISFETILDMNKQIEQILNIQINSLKISL